LYTIHFSDISPADGINLYRINHTSIGGTVDYSNAKAVVFNKSIQIFPNPAKDKLSVSIPGNNKPVTLQLTDSKGTQIKTYKAAGANIRLNLPVLAAGTYYLNVIKTDGTSSHKIVIQ